MRALISAVLIAVLAVGCVQPAASLRGTSTAPNRNLQTNQTQDLCASIIAIALTPDPSSRNKQPNQRALQTKAAKVSKFTKRPTNAPTPKPTIDESVAEPEQGEQFVCERSSTGEMLPLIGSEEQMDQLRDALNNGQLISAETTIVGLTEEDLESVNLPPSTEGNPFTTDIGSDSIESETVVNLPTAGMIQFKPGNGRHSLQRRALNQRDLAVYTGVKKVLFVKVTDKDGLAHPDNARTMSDKIFGTYGDTTTMKDQFEACSFGDMKITNEYGFNLGNAEAAPGVIEVRLSISLKSSSRNQIQQAAKAAAEAKIGRSLPGPFDHVMYSLERCYNECGWAAYAGVNSWFSIYQGNNYKFPAVALHEIGHNLNLAHSGGDDGKTYTDHSCLMGNPWFRDDVSAMCYNPAKSFQLSQQGSWYHDRVVTWDSGDSRPNVLVQNLVGIADYGNSPDNYAVVVKLETGTSTDLFVGFNRASGINSATKDGKNMVTIVEQDRDGVGYATSKMLSILSSGESYKASNWQKSGKDLVVTVRNIQSGQAPWYAEVEFNFDNASSGTPPPTPSPTPKPSPEPTMDPTPAPSKQPATAAPTKTCGDQRCAADESEETCPADCVNAEFSTYDDNVGAKGANGTMWTIEALRDVEINSIYTFVRNSAVDLVQVYTRQGSYNGFEGSDAGWNLVFDKNILLNGINQVTELSFTNKVTIAAGQSQSFYVYSPSNLAYRSEDVSEGDLIKSDDSFRFFAGVAVAYGKFGEGQVFSPRVFSGLISYNAISSGSDTSSPTTPPTRALPTSIPTASPSSLCGNSVCPPPTTSPTPKPSPEPTMDPTTAPSKQPATAAPTITCGDQRCAADESEETCPADCVNAEFSTYDDNVGAKGANGTMWTIEALRDVEINSIYTFVRSNAVDLVQVYTRQGSYNGFEGSDAGWNLVFDKNILLNGINQVTELSFTNKVTIAAGQSQSFYVYSPSNLAYRSEDVSEGDLIKSDDSFRFFAGVAVAYGKFGEGRVFSPRVFSGLISYNAISSGSDTSSPTTPPTRALPTSIPTASPSSLCGNSVCDPMEHSDVCPVDCSNIEYYGAASGDKGADGIMFSIKPLRDIVVTSFDVYGVTTGASLFQVYTKIGTWQGQEDAQSNWTLFYDNPSLEQKGRFTLTSLGDFANGVLIQAGSVQSFYLYTPTKLMYDVGDGSSPYSSNSDLELNEGAGITGGLFAGGDASQNVVAPRVFAGTFRYDVIEGSSVTFSPTTKPTASPSLAPTTLAPTKQPAGALLCGNGVCDIFEDAETCPSDCEDVIFNANDVGAKGAEGTMFSVKALRNVTIKSFDFFGSNEASAVVQVYTRTGSYQGHEASMDGWSLVFNATVDQLGRKNATSLDGLDNEVAIAANSMQSFLIYSPNKIMYKAGTSDTSEGALFASDGNLEFFEGIGLDGALFNGTVYSPRVFRGSVIYDVNRESSPNTCGNDICEAYESAGACPSDCRDLSLETTPVAAKGAAGAMFDIKALRDISITSLDFFGASTNVNLVQVYTRSGTYKGNEGSSNGWELVFDNSSVDIKGRFEPTPLGSFTRDVHIPADSFQSFFIYSPSKVMYRGGTSDTSEGALHASNDAIEFYEGISVDGFFAGDKIYSPRVWRGTIRFNGV